MADSTSSPVYTSPRTGEPAIRWADVPDGAAVWGLGPVGVRVDGYRTRTGWSVPGVPRHARGEQYIPCRAWVGWACAGMSWVDIEDVPTQVPTTFSGRG